MNINVLKKTNIFAQLSEAELACIVSDLVERRYEEGEIIFHMRRSPQLALNFMQELSQRVRYNTRQMDSLVTLPVPARLARKLVELAQEYGRATSHPTQGVHIDLALTQSQLASLIGASRESTNKSLGDFQRRQWVQLAQGHIIVLDPDGLRGQVQVGG